MARLLIITDNAFTYTGREKICDFMVESLGGSDDVDVFSLRGDGLPFYNYKNAKELRSFAREKYPLLSIIKEINKRDYDLVFVVSMGRLSVYFSFLFSIFGRKSKESLIACEHVSLDSLSVAIRFLKRIALSKYDKVVVLTERDGKKLASWGINNTVIYNPIKYNNHKKINRSRHALAVGRLSKQKNFSSLLNIWSRFIKNNHSDWMLNIAGDGELKDELIQQASRLKISNNVQFLGRINNIDDYYKNADLCLMTSIYEGLPLALLEAKSWSVPVIAYDCPTGPREIISDKVDGFLVELNDEDSFLANLEYLASNDNVYFQLSAGTCNVSSQFSEEKIKSLWRNLVCGK